MSIKFKGLKEFERKLKDLPKAVEKKFRNKTVEVTVASGTSDREAEEALEKALGAVQAAGVPLEILIANLHSLADGAEESAKT